MRGIIAEKIYHLLPNGECSNCKARIRIIGPEETIYKTRLLKVEKNKRALIKCPNCREMLIVE